MDAFKIETRPGSAPQGLPRVVVYGCTPADEARLTAQLLAEADCAVLCPRTEESAPLPAVELAVVAVTEAWLALPASARPLPAGVPVLPLVERPALAKRAQRRFGPFAAEAKWCEGVARRIPAAGAACAPVVQLAAFVCRQLGELEMNAANPQAGTRWYGRELELWNKLTAAAGTPDARHRQALACLRMGDACYAEGQMRETQYWYRLAISNSEKLVQQAGDERAQLCLARCCTAMGEMFQWNEEYSRAAAQYQKTLQILEPLAEASTSAALQEELSVCLGRMGELCRQQDDHPGAERWLNRKLQQDERRAAQFGGDEVQLSIAEGLGRLGGVLMDLNRVAEAEAAYRRSLGAAEPLCAAGSEAAQRRWQSVCDAMADLNNRTGGWKTAQEWEEKSITGWRAR